MARKPKTHTLPTPDQEAAMQEMVNLSQELHLYDEPKPMSLIQKIQLSHALTSALDNKPLQDVVLNLPQGQKLWDILTNAIEKELELILQGPKEQAPALAVDLNSTLQAASHSLNELRSLVTGMYNTPLTQALSTMLRLMNQPELFTKIAASVANLPIPAPAPAGSYPQQYQTVPMQQGNTQVPAQRAPGMPTANPYITDQSIAQSHLNLPPELF